MFRKISTDRIIGVSAMFISLISLLFFIQQTRMMNQQNRLSVMPRLSFTETQSNHSDNFTIGLILKNKGLGPAIIESSAILYRGKRYDLDFSAFIDERLVNLDTLLSRQQTSSVTEGTTILPREEERLFFLELPPKNVPILQENFGSVGDSIDVEIIYTSIYEERWLIRWNSEPETPQRL
ncbi:MAG: hypothetical protein AAFU03_08280 [Bacteroidota bacterium]